MSKIKVFLKNEAVLVISALCAAATMLLVPPDSEYLSYIDFRVLCLLLCLMAVVAGLKSVGVFSSLTYQLLNRVKSGRILGLVLVLLPFFTSMLITNDVALIIFIPFTIALLEKSDCRAQIIAVTVMQTVAANLGSMATPVGNPQNLFLFSSFSLGYGEFFGVTLPLTAVSLAALSAVSLFLLPKKLSINEIEKEGITDRKQLIAFIILFVLSVLSVLRVMPYQLATAITVGALLLISRRLFKEIDFMLLLTFVCFFIISENLSRLDVVRTFLQALLKKSTLMTSIATSQIISNVPAAVLLSGFTENIRDLLAGVNIGGLGTPIASLASLITLKLYMKSHGAKAARFLLFFTVTNIIGLVLLTAVSLLI